MMNRTSQGLSAPRAGRSHSAHCRSEIESLGELMGAVIHEVNQPLTAIAAGAQAAVHWLAAGDHGSALQAIQGVVHDATRANAVVTGLKGFLRGYDTPVQPLQINEAVREVLAVVCSDIEAAHVAVALELDSSLPAVAGNRVQLQQVILNIVLNSMDAIKRKGVEGRIRVRSRLIDGPNVEVSISDNGTGVAPEFMPRLFDVFYTTKSDGLGLGL